MQDKSKPFEHVSFVAPAFYYQNFKIFFPPKEEGDTLVFTLPETSSITAFDVYALSLYPFCCSDE